MHFDARALSAAREMVCNIVFEFPWCTNSLRGARLTGQEQERETGNALVLGRFDFMFFEAAPEGTSLKRWLRGEDDPAGAAYAYKNSAARFWQFDYWDAPRPFSRGSEDTDPGDKASLDAYNAWATQSGLRHNLGELAARTFADGRHEISLRDGQPAMT